MWSCIFRATVTRIVAPRLRHRIVDRLEEVRVVAVEVTAAVVVEFHRGPDRCPDVGIAGVWMHTLHAVEGDAFIRMLTLVAVAHCEAFIEPFYLLGVGQFDGRSGRQFLAVEVVLVAPELEGCVLQRKRRRFPVDVFGEGRHRKAYLW
jgi:hypothetical protein